MEFGEIALQCRKTDMPEQRADLQGLSVVSAAMNMVSDDPADGLLPAAASADPACTPSSAHAPHEPAGPAPLAPAVQQFCDRQRPLQQQLTWQLHMLQQQCSIFSGIPIPLHLLNAIADLEDELMELRTELDRACGAIPASLRPVMLLPAEQHAIVQALALLTGVPLDLVTLLELAPARDGLWIMLPLEAAAHILALHQIRHPELDRLGITAVVLTAAMTSTRQPAMQSVQNAAAHTCAQLLAAIPDDVEFRSLLNALHLPHFIDSPNRLKLMHDFVNARLEQHVQQLAGQGLPPLPHGQATLYLGLSGSL